MASNPKISVISPSFNTGKFARSTFDSVMKQSYHSFEYIVVDGGSTDGTIDILKEYEKKYPNFRWISEKDGGVLDALRKGFAMARGEYVMNCCISDGYLDMEWFGKCAEALDRDKEVSLVWAFNQYITEDGVPGDILFRQFYKNDPPQKTDYVYYWMVTYDGWPENNFCVRKQAFDACFPHYKKEYADRRVLPWDPWNEFNYNFNSQGYLPYFVRTVAGWGRMHEGQLSERQRQSKISKTILANFIGKIRRYRGAVLSGKVQHHWRDGEGNVMPQKFSRAKFWREQVLSPKGITRIAFRSTAVVLRPSARFFMSHAATPAPLKKAIKSLKNFYGGRQ